MTCGKQTKGVQSKKDSGLNAPVDRVGGVICGDLKGPITPKNRLGNRYLVSFIDHKSNYCQAFFRKQKIKWRRSSRTFLIFIEKR